MDFIPSSFLLPARCHQAFERATDDVAGTSEVTEIGYGKFLSTLYPIWFLRLIYHATTCSAWPCRAAIVHAAMHEPTSHTGADRARGAAFAKMCEQIHLNERRRHVADGQY